MPQTVTSEVTYNDTRDQIYQPIFADNIAYTANFLFIISDLKIEDFYKIKCQKGNTESRLFLLNLWRPCSYF